MLRFILFDTSLFDTVDTKESLDDTRTDLMWCQEALAILNQNYLKRHPETPPLYKSGVVYKLPAQFDGDPVELSTLKNALGSKANQADVASVLDTISNVFGGERFRDIGRILENGGGDCDNLANWRVAELRQAGIAAKPYMTNRARSDGGTTYHALVQWPPFANVPYPTSEDPSLLLGMSQPQRAADRDEEIRKNQERCALIKKYGIKPVSAAPQQSPSFVSDLQMANFDDALQGILGIAPRAQAVDFDDSPRDQSEIANLWRRR